MPPDMVIVPICCHPLKYKVDSHLHAKLMKGIIKGSFYNLKNLAPWVNKMYLSGKLVLLLIIVFIWGPKNVLSHDNDFIVKVFLLF